jgi:outer membrane lipoprotein-sorting protein
MHAGNRAGLLEDIATAAVPETIDLWPRLRVEIDSRSADGANCRRNQTGWTGAWNRATLSPCALTAAALALAVILGLGLLAALTRAQIVSAETILDRATGPATVQTYHLLMSRQAPANGAQTDVTEVWFDGPDRQRATQRTTDASGAGVPVQDVIFSGSEVWTVTTDHGQTRAIHTVGTTWNKPAVAPTTQGSPAELLDLYGERQCVAAHLQPGSATVAGQATYVLDLAQKTGGCGAIPVASAAPVASPVAAGARTTGQLQSIELEKMNQKVSVWVDEQTFLPLKTEVRDPGGALVQRSEVTSIAYNVPMADSTFAYAPPAGVSVSTFTGGTGADVKRALNTAPEGKAQTGARR